MYKLFYILAIGEAALIKQTTYSWAMTTESGLVAEDPLYMWDVLLSILFWGLMLLSQHKQHTNSAQAKIEFGVCVWAHLELGEDDVYICLCPPWWAACVYTAKITTPFLCPIWFAAGFISQLQEHSFLCLQKHAVYKGWGYSFSALRLIASYYDRHNLPTSKPTNSHVELDAIVAVFIGNQQQYSVHSPSWLAS